MRTETHAKPGITLPDPLHIKINPQDLLDTLRSFPALASLQLTISCEQEILLPRNSRHLLCGSLGNNATCEENCRSSFEKAFREAIGENRPVIFSCAAGLLNFAVPFRNEKHQACCLFAGGVREEALDLALPEQLANADALLEKIQQRPQRGRAQLAETLAKVMALLPMLADEQTLGRPLRNLTQRLATITSAAAELDRAKSSADVLDLLGETLILLFDLPRILILLTEGDSLAVKLKLGGTPQLTTIARDKLQQLLATERGGKPTVLHQKVGDFFPGIDSDRAVCAPLEVEGHSLGMVVLFDVHLQVQELMMIELLMARAAAKFQRLQQEDQQRQEHALSQRLIAMVGELALAGSRNALYQKIVAMSCELLHASRGSLMLIDETGEQLSIVAAQGINLEVARSLPIQLGEGIAGRVAKSGLHLLVTDIEKDCRVALPNRPRFKTKSFICFPMKDRDRIVGVLNLADKETDTIFTDADLKNLQLLVDHAARLIDRVATFEDAQKLEDLAARDPLTDLYNRRMLEARFQEELNRYSRLQQAFTIMMVDLDHFKAYNDQCGHIAGDHALKKIAGLLKKSAREMDIVTRYGGEEFCLLLPNTGKEEALFVAERMRRAIEAEKFPGETALPLGKLTTSIGIASYPTDGEKLETLVNAADIALYQAKSKGRNRLATFELVTRGHSKKPG